MKDKELIEKARAWSHNRHHYPPSWAIYNSLIEALEASLERGDSLASKLATMEKELASLRASQALCNPVEHGEVLLKAFEAKRWAGMWKRAAKFRRDSLASKLKIAHADSLLAELQLARKVISFAASLLSEERMKDEANCYAVYPAYLEAKAAYDASKGEKK